MPTATVYVDGKSVKIDAHTESGLRRFIRGIWPGRKVRRILSDLYVIR